MSAPFDASRHKLDNAASHIETAGQLVTEYQLAFPMTTVRVEMDQAVYPGIVGMKFVPSAPVPVKIPLAVGDAIHNMRSALDILAVEAVSLSGGNPKNVYFPFATDEDNLDDRIKSKNFHRASAEAIDLLKSFKPHSAGNELLRAIHDLDITDKHHLMIPTAEGAIIPYVKIGTNSFSNLKVSSSIADIAYPKSVTPIIVGHAECQIIFDPDGPIRHADVVPSLREMLQLCQSIVEAFAALFGAVEE